MQERFLARLKIIGAVFFFYFLPWTLLAFYTEYTLPPAERWTFLSIALCTVLCATLLLIVCIRQFENKIAAILTDSEDLDHGSARAQDAEEVDMEGPYALLYEETLEQLKNQQVSSQGMQEELRRAELRYSELEAASQAQQLALNMELEEEKQRSANRQKQILSLENSARELKYEIKNLVDTTEQRPHPKAHDTYDIASLFPTKPLGVFLEPISTLSSAESQLRLCVDIAQKFTGARHLTHSSYRSQNASVEGYDLDLRRLTDTLLSVTERPILLYHPKLSKLLFISPQIKHILGWSAEKYLQDFTALFPEGQEQWDEYLRQLPLLGVLELNKPLVTNIGESLPMNIHLGWIPTGIFKAHVIGVLEKVPQLVS